MERIVDDAINYVSRGGTLLVYGVYDDAARVSWSPNRIFHDQIRSVQVEVSVAEYGRIIGSFAQIYCFPRAVQLLRERKVVTKGMV